MNFNSPEFLFFLPATLVFYALVFRHDQWREYFLIGVSYFFYMSWNWRYAALLAYSTVVDYFVGRLLERTIDKRVRRTILIVSLISNLGLLAIFKYYNFFLDVAESPLTLLGWNVSALHHELLLPVGISFYTFQTMSYTIDLYRGENVLERNFLKFAVFVSFFPQLIAGPIVRAKQFLPQLHRPPNFSTDRIHDGLLLVFRGLFKKVVIADLLATLAIDKVFASPSEFSSWDLLFALYAYAFQIYNDFSGYSDIAIGAARMLGFELPVNFNRPYLAQNIREFWTRWHISLSTWLRDYLYISLGGNRCSAMRIKANLLLTMLLGGLWHGASAHFVAWGAYHGVLLIASRMFPQPETPSNTWLTIGRRLRCFHLVVVGWLLFRVQDFQNLSDYVGGLLKLSGGTSFHGLFYLVLVLAVTMHVIPISGLTRMRDWFVAVPVPAQAAVYAGLLLLYCGVTVEAPSFIYFQF